MWSTGLVAIIDPCVSRSPQNLQTPGARMFLSDIGTERNLRTSPAFHFHQKQPGDASCHAATSRPIPTSRSARPNTSRKATRSAASEEGGRAPRLGHRQQGERRRQEERLGPRQEDDQGLRRNAAAGSAAAWRQGRRRPSSRSALTVCEESRSNPQARGHQTIGCRKEGRQEDSAQAIVRGPDLFLSCRSWLRFAASSSNGCERTVAGKTSKAAAPTMAVRTGRRASANAAVDAVFKAYPAALRRKLLVLRRLIRDTAKTTKGVGALEETLKWGSRVI